MIGLSVAKNKMLLIRRNSKFPIDSPNLRMPQERVTKSATEWIFDGRRGSGQLSLEKGTVRDLEKGETTWREVKDTVQDRGQ